MDRLKDARGPWLVLVGAVVACVGGAVFALMQGVYDLRDGDGFTVAAGDFGLGFLLGAAVFLVIRWVNRAVAE